MAKTFMNIRNGLGLKPVSAPSDPLDGDVYYDSGTNKVTVRENGSWVSYATTAQAANVSLSNLSSVAINTSLLPNTTLSIDLGSAAKIWLNAHLQGATLYGSTSGSVLLRAADTTTTYTVKWPNAQGGASTFLQNDGSGNLSWQTASGFSGRANGTANTISASATSKAVTFSSTLGTTNYAVIAMMNNLVDANPQFQPITITNKSATGFTATWNAPTDSANYILEYIAVPNV